MSEYLYAIQLPKMVQVLRLFWKEELKEPFIDPSKIQVDSPGWIDTKRNTPDKKALYYVKDLTGKKISKAFYIGPLDYAPKDHYWYEPFADNYIPNHVIGFWMEISREVK